MTGPYLHREDWKVVGVVERKNEQYVIEQKYALYKMENPDGESSMVSHPIDEKRVRPVTEL